MSSDRRRSHRFRPVRLLAAVLVVCGGCSGPEPAAERAASPSTARPEPTVQTEPTGQTEPTAQPQPTEPATEQSGAGNDPAVAPPLTRPAWLGQRPLTTDGNGYGISQPTPAELVDRKLPTIDTLPPPLPSATGVAPRFVSTISPFEGEPLARSTWREGCPVEPEQLRYVTVSFWGFDGQPHTGELVLAADSVDDVVGVFEVAWNERFPFEEMRIVTPADLEAEPTGDGNNTASFVCRAVTGGSRFSEHAFGLAVDINPFHNPYLRGVRLLPELAGAYLQREDARDGMLFADSPVVVAFAEIGWSWGGEWTSLKDWHHFSHNGL